MMDRAATDKVSRTTSELEWGGQRICEIHKRFEPWQIHLMYSSAPNERPDIGSILHALAQSSRRPRYAFMVLGLIAEAARPDGRAGPWVADTDGVPQPLREWVAGKLVPLAAHDRRRATLRRKVEERLGPRASDAALVAAALEEEALAVGKANVSRAVSDLVKAGFVRRYYAGRVKGHQNRGGGRHAVYIVSPPVLNAMRSRPTLV